MTILPLLAWNLIVPAATSATIICLARWSFRSEPPSRRGRWGVALGLGIGYLTGHIGLLGWPGLPTPMLDVKVWIAWLTLVAVIVGIIEASAILPSWVTWIVRGLLVAAVLALLLRSRIEHAWTVGESALWLTGLWLILFVSWWNLEAQAERLSGPGWLVPIGLVIAGWAVVQWLSRSGSLAQLDGVLAAAAVGALFTVGLRPGPALSKGGPAVVSITTASLGLAGYFYSEIPSTPALILILAPWTPWIDRIGLIRRRSYWTRASIRFLAVLLTVGTAVFLTDTAREDLL